MCVAQQGAKRPASACLPSIPQPCHDYGGGGVQVSASSGLLLPSLLLSLSPAPFQSLCRVGSVLLGPLSLLPMAEQLEEVIPFWGGWVPKRGSLFLSLLCARSGQPDYPHCPAQKLRLLRVKDLPKVMLTGGYLTSTLDKMRQALLTVK